MFPMLPYRLQLLFRHKKLEHLTWERCPTSWFHSDVHELIDSAAEQPSTCLGSHAAWGRYIASCPPLPSATTLELLICDCVAVPCQLPQRKGRTAEDVQSSISHPWSLSVRSHDPAMPKILWTSHCCGRPYLLKFDVCVCGAERSAVQCIAFEGLGKLQSVDCHLPIALNPTAASFVRHCDVRLHIET